ncbi:peroxisome biogenesis factor 2 [Electrophorus electricus]|uniref:Peroxisome biogenesis factor 2 n=1 Tax=Electrophorus electricus TaxID=8005 RepID=A0A4W4F1C8_ELEEL|nr:peroxisome biogenesis factor 2 [Electrophorus electricus]
MAGASGEAEASQGPLSPVLRISQLDAFELDAALEQLVWAQFSRCFQHLRPGLLTPGEPELRALLQLLIWSFTVYSNSATVGQTLLHIRYRSTLVPGPHPGPMSRQQKLWYALLTVGGRWVRERLPTLLLGHAPDLGMQRARGALAIVGGMTKASGLLNFLLFLRSGTFPTLTERLLGVEPVHSQPQGPRHLNFSYMNRELLWHGFAEFLIFLLPLVSASRLRAAAATLFAIPAAAGRGRDVGGATECAVCREWPTMPHSIGCGHVFCYYCVKSHTIRDVFFTCPKCGAEVATLEPVKLQIELTEMHPNYE